MFERFTDRARRVVVLAQEEARLLNHNYIGTEHILLGLINEGDGVAAKALESLGISLGAARAEVEEVIGQGSVVSSGHIPFTPRSKKVLELSLREALQLGHNYIGTEHLLLGLIREGEGVAAQVLVKLGTNVSRVRQQVIQTLSGYARTDEPRRREARQTPAAVRARAEAEALAPGERVGSHHLLLAVLHDERSLAAKVLKDLGVTSEAVEHRLAELTIEGTSDETPEEAGGRRIQLRVVGDRLEISVNDPELVQGMREVVVTGTDPAGASFPELWNAIRDTSRVVRSFQNDETEATPPED